MYNHLVREGNKIFLKNDIADYGSLCWWVSAKVAEEGEEVDRPLRGTVRIADCHNQIHLDFSCDDDEDFDSRMQKVEEMINELKAFKKAFRKGKGAL